MTRLYPIALAIVAILGNTCVALVGVTSPPAWWLPVVVCSCIATIGVMLWSVIWHA